MCRLVLGLLPKCALPLVVALHEVHLDELRLEEYFFGLRTYP